MKIVINKCYGGFFSLSPQAVARLAELRGQKAYFFTGGRLGGEPRVPVTPEEAAESTFWRAYNTPTPAPDTYSLKSIDERIDRRTDPLLVQVVEELGVRAEGQHAELRVVEIPDGVDYTIEDYDGMETVHEKHRVW